MLSDVRGDEPDEHSESEDESNWWAESGPPPPPRGDPGTAPAVDELEEEAAAARDGLTEVPCGCGMRKVPSDEDDDGVPEAEAAAEDGQDDGQDLPVDDDDLPDRLSSSPNLGRGRDMGRSSRLDGRSLRGSVGGSSFSS